MINCLQEVKQLRKFIILFVIASLLAISFTNIASAATLYKVSTRYYPSSTNRKIKADIGVKFDYVKLSATTYKITKMYSYYNVTPLVSGWAFIGSSFNGNIDSRNSTSSTTWYRDFTSIGYIGRYPYMYWKPLYNSSGANPSKIYKSGNQVSVQENYTFGLKYGSNPRVDWYQRLSYSYTFPYPTI